MAERTILIFADVKMFKVKRKSNCGQKNLSKQLLAFYRYCSRHFRIRAKKMVGVRGFEPPASASRTQRSSQTEPHPDRCFARVPRCFINISRFCVFASGIGDFSSIIFEKSFYARRLPRQMNTAITIQIASMIPEKINIFIQPNWTSSVKASAVHNPPPMIGSCRSCLYPNACVAQVLDSGSTARSSSNPVAVTPSD